MLDLAEMRAPLPYFVAVKVYVPVAAVVGVPVMAPLFGSSARPAGSAGLTVQASGEVDSPNVAAKVAE